MKRPPLKEGDIYPAHVLRDEYGMNAANRPEICVDESQVPESLRSLIPAVERWAIPCDVTRGDYFDQQPEADIAGFWYDVLPYVEAVGAWLDSQPEDDGEWSEAAIHFMYFLKAHDEAWQPSQEEKSAIEERRAAAERSRARKTSISSAMEELKAKNYQRVIVLLEPFEAELDKVSAARLKLARRKANS